MIVDSSRLQMADGSSSGCLWLSDGTEEPDSAACVAISTDASLREMIAPGALVMLTPIIIGFLFGPLALAGTLAGTLVSGVQMAISSSNTGASFIFTEMADVMMNATAAAPWLSYDYIMDPVADWSQYQLASFPILFILPAEFLALIVDAILWWCGMGLPLLPLAKYPPMDTTAWTYVYFNRFVVLPFLSFIIVRIVQNSSAVVWDMEQMTLMNTLLGFVLVFSLSDLTYYTGHRIVHKVPFLYKFVHKHHHKESHPRRGWVDTSNAHPTDFFYTGFLTCPISCLWVFPAASVHIVAIGLAMWSVMFVGALGHSRIDINIGVFNSRFHAGHHALTFCNYAQNIELWDRLFGTYKDLPMKGANVPPLPWKIEKAPIAKKVE